MIDKAVILAVDDTAESLALLAGILTPAGYHVLPADSGELALAAVAANMPDLILLDVRLKGISGLEVCRRLKAAEETRHIPIILISAFADVKEWVEGLQMGAADYISKPFQSEELLSRVKTHLALSRANAAVLQQSAALHQANEQMESEIGERQRVEKELRQTLDQATRSRKALLSAIEDHQQAEDSLRETRDYLNSLIGYANAPIITWDTDKRITIFNHAFEILTGYPATEMLGQSLNVLFPPESSAESLKKIASTSAGEFWDAVEIPIKRKNGEVRIALWNSANVYGKDGKTVVATIAQGQDISERKQAEILLRDEKERIRTILDLVGDPIFVKDNDHRITLANHAFYAMFCMDENSVIGKTLVEAVPENERHHFLKVDRRVLDTGEPDLREEELTAKDLTRTIITRKTRFIDESGKRFLVGSLHDITERKQAEAALTENEKKYRALFETMSEGIVYEDHDGRIISANPAAERLLGLSLEQLQGRTSIDPRSKAIHEDGSPFPGETHSLYVAAKTGKPTKDEVMGIYNPQTGAYVWLSINSTPEFLPNEKEPFRAFAVFHDITERKQAESQREIAHEALKREQFLNNVIINSIPGAFYVLDENGRYTRWNAYQRDEIIGKPEDQVAGANAADTIHPDDRELIKSRIANVLGRGREETVEGRVLLRGGPAYRWLLMTGRQIMIAGRPLLVGIGIDISDRKRTEESLQESERKFRETVVSLDEGYYSVTLDGKLLEHNHAFNRILGFDIHEDLKGVQLPDFWQDPEQRKEYLQALAANGSISNYPIEAKTQKGDKITILASAHLVKDENNQPRWIEGAFMDISQRMRAEAEIRRLNEELEQRVVQRTVQLEAANKELEAFSYSVSHDLRAPLRAIDGFSRIVLEEYAPKLDDEGRRLLDVITGNTEKMGRLIDDLLAFSRLSRQQIAFATVDMAVLAETIFSELNNLEKGRKIEFKVSLLPPGFGDRSMLRQILQNLLANAIKFTRTRKTARIELGGKVGEGEIIFYVKDNGVGFDMAYADKLFGVFQRLHGTR